MIGSGIIIALLIAFFGAVYWLFFYTGSTKEIVAVADQLQVDPSWKLETESIRPPQSFCVDVECPSVSRNWKVSEPLIRKDLENLLEASGWNFQIEETCIPDTTMPQQPSGSCSAKGIVGNYNVTLGITYFNNSEQTSVVGLSVTESVEK